MRRVTVDGSFEGWRIAARALLADGIAPDDVSWHEDPLPPPVPVPAPAGSPRVPAVFIERARHVARHRDPSRIALLYRLLWRITHGERSLVDNLADPDMARFTRMYRDMKRTPASSVVTAPGRDATRFLPIVRDVENLRRAANACTACPISSCATQAVFGRGPANARIVLIGEQPGDEEDIAGAPFVGPAGRVLEDVLTTVGLDRGALYVTNALKHFKWTPRGQRRLHERPTHAEMAACRPWLLAELDVIRPEIVVCLGVTAARAILGGRFRMHEERGRPRATPWAPWTFCTYHPSSLLRSGDDEKSLIEAHFLADMRLVAERAAALNLAVTHDVAARL